MSVNMNVTSIQIAMGTPVKSSFDLSSAVNYIAE